MQPTFSSQRSCPEGLDEEDHESTQKLKQLGSSMFPGPFDAFWKWKHIIVFSACLQASTKKFMKLKI